MIKRPNVGTVFSLSLFPQVYLFHRVKRAQVIFAMGDEAMNAQRHANISHLRVTRVNDLGQPIRVLKIPVECEGANIDSIRVSDPHTWKADFSRQVRRAYRGLEYGEAAVQLVHRALADAGKSIWLTDYLVATLDVTLQYLGWKDKTIERGESHTRRMVENVTQHIVGLCVDHDVGQLLTGQGQRLTFDRGELRESGIELVEVSWFGSEVFNSRDSILDAIARFSPEDIVKRLD